MRLWKRMLVMFMAGAIIIAMLPTNVFASEKSDETTFKTYSSTSDEVASGTCGDDLTWVLDEDGTLTISGTGAMTSWSKLSKVPWYSYRTSIISIIINNGATSISRLSFGYCENLTSVTIPDGVTSIDSEAFSGCTNLTSVTIPDSVTYIGSKAFSGCTNLTSIIIPSSVTTIYDYAFESCTSLTNVTIPDSVTSIGSYAFESCTSLTSVTIGKGITAIDVRTFYECINLTTISIPDGVKTISDFAFYNCESLTSVTIPASVAFISNGAFFFCESLTDVYYAGSEDDWDAISIASNNTHLTSATIHYNYTGAEEDTANLIWDGTTADTYAGGDGSQDNPYQISTAEQLAKISDDSDNDYYYILVNDIYLNDINSGYTNTWTSITPFNGSFDGQGYCIYGLYGGGLFGNSTGTIQNVRVSDSYITSGYGASPLYVGAIAGNASYISRCSTSDTVTVYVSSTSSSNQVIYVGGLVGSATTVDQCFNEGTVSATGTYMVSSGGIIGQSNGGEVTNCYNIGDISATSTYGSGYSYCGGIIGSANMTSPAISYCYNTASIGTSSYHGGIIGLTTTKYPPTLTNCYTLDDEDYYSNNLVGYTFSSSYGGYTATGCARLSKSEMESEESYTGFDFDSIWTFVNGKNSGYPLLQWSYDTESNSDNEDDADTNSDASLDDKDNDDEDTTDFNLNIYRAEKLLDDTIPLGTTMSASISQTTPCALYVPALQEAGFELYSSAWDTLTAVFDTVDNPSTLYDLSVEESDIYSAVILNVLQAATEYGFVDTCKGNMDEFSSCLSEIVTILKLDYNIDFSYSYDFSRFTDEELETLQDVTEEVFKSEYADITLLNEMFSNIGKAYDIADDIETYVEQCASIYAILEMDESMVTVVETMYEECPSSNVNMKLALKDCVDILNSSAEEVALELLSGAVTMIGAEAASIAVDFVWDTVKETVLNVGWPEIEIFMAGYKTGKFISNTLFQTDSTIEQYCRMLAILDVEDLLDDVYDTLLLEYQSRPNSASAAAYLSVIDVIYNARDYDCQCAYTFVDILDDALANKIGALFDQTEADQRVSIRSSIDSIQRSYAVSHENVLTGWISYLEEDYPDSGLYEQYYGLYKESLNRILTKKYVAACPVDVYVYDEDNNLVAYVIDGIPYCSTNNITIFIQDDTKTLYFYNDKEYRVEYVGTDTGTMDLTVTEYDEDGNEQRNVYFYDILLEDGNSYETNVDGLELGDTSYVLESGSSTTINPDLDTYQPTSALHTVTLVSASIVIDGEQYFESTAYADEHIRVYAYVPEGYEFVGWTSNAGDSIFNDPEAQVTNLRMPDQDVTVTAVLKLTETDDTDSSEDSSTGTDTDSGNNSSTGDSGSSGSTSSDDTTSFCADSLCVRRGNAYHFSYTIHAGNADKIIYYGRTADEVLVGDWDGDGVDTICVRRGNTYYFSNSLKSGNADQVIYYGKATDEVLVGDWDGDGKDTLAVRRGNAYYISNTIKSGNADKVVYYGKATDIVLAGDWDGDGKDTLTVRRGNAYYVSNMIKSGNADKVVYYGKATDSVLVGDWDGDNVDTLAVRRGNTYYISNAIKSGNADKVIAYGKATDEVYAGTWK